MAGEPTDRLIEDVRHRLDLILEGIAGGEERNEESLARDLTDLNESLSELVTSNRRLLDECVELHERQRVTESERTRFAELFALAPDAYLVTDRPGKIKEANRAAATLLGLPIDDLIGQSMESFIVGGDQEHFRSGLDRLLRTGTATDWEIQFAPKDRASLVARVTARTIVEQEHDGITWQLRDVSERKQFEADLEAAHQVMGGVLQNIPVVVFRIDKEGELTEAIGRGLEEEGLGERFQSGRNMLVDYPQCREKMERALEGEAVHFETQGVESGKPWWALCHVSFDSAYEGGAIGIAIDVTDLKLAHEALQRARDDLELRIEERTAQFAIANERLRDEISDRRETETELRHSEERARALLDVIPDMMFRVGGDGTILDFRADESQPLLISRDLIIGTNLGELPFPGSIIEDLRNLMAKAISTGSLQEYEYEIELAGTSQAFEARIVRSGSDETVSIIRDITERRRSEARAQKHQIELAHVTRLSTMGEMASGLAHELNQPLAAIRNYAAACVELMRADRPENQSEILGWMREIGGQASRAGEIIRRLRYLVSKRRPQRVAASLEMVTKEILSLIEAEARIREIGIKLEFEDSLPDIWGDTVQIQQVILNLLRNAIEAMVDSPADDRDLLIHGRKTEDGMIEFAVVDRGGGVPPEMIDEVFEPFFSTKADGMGMGLSISRWIIEDHGGKLWVEKNTEHGATFRFTLPPHDPRGGSHRKNSGD